MISFLFSKAFMLCAQYILVSSLYSTNVDYSHDNKKLICPVVCNQMACLMGILTCSETGLSEIPKQLPPKTNKILLINQDFSEAGTLTRYNLSEYSALKHNITKITIQNCSLLAIEPKAFSKLSYLQTLDLSFNKITMIESYTFADLKLNFLRLDGNEKLKFTSNSFKDLVVSSLSMIGCQLTHLPFPVLEPIYSGLVRLMLTNNHFTTLDSKYEALFQKLQVFGLADNRFDCSQCSLIWMTNSMKARFYKNQDKDPQTMIYPQCYTPYKLKGKLIHTLSVSDFQCPKPSIEKISIFILPNNTAQLICTASDMQSDVIWSQIIEPNENSMLYSSKIMDISNSPHSNKLLISQKREVDSFLCTVTSLIGNASSTRLQIAWPKYKVHSRLLNNTNKNVWSEPYTPIPGEKYSKNYFFQPQFSLIEMISGVVGTFIATLIVFITMLRCIFYRIRLFSKNSQLRDHQLSLTSSKKDKRKQYMTYEPPIYSDSQTYDIPSLPVNQSTLGHFLDFKTQQTLYSEKNQ